MQGSPETYVDVGNRALCYGALVATPDTKHSIVLIKQMTYRGATRTFSNRYHFEGDLPADNTAWTTFAQHIRDAEKAIYDDTVTIVQAVGYDAGTATPTNPHGDAVFSTTFATPGTGNFSATGPLCPGDCAMMMRYSTPARSTKNHPVYLFNYYHGVYRQTANADLVNSDQLTALNAYGDDWVAGFSDGTETRERCGPRGAVATGANADTFVRHRDFPN